MLVLALLLVIVALAAGLGMARYGDRIPGLAPAYGVLPRGYLEHPLTRVPPHAHDVSPWEPSFRIVGGDTADI